MLSFLQYSSGLFDVCEAYGLRLVMDSGAYTKPLSSKDIERYARIICTLGDRCEWYANADVIGDQRQSNANYTLLISLLPPELHHKVLWVYQVSAPLSYLDEGLERFGSIGIGGLVRLLAQDSNGTKLLSVVQRIAQTQVYPHYFGLGQARWLRLLRDIHAGRYSSDSSTWLVGAKFDRLIRYDGRQIPVKNTGFSFTPAEILAQNIRTMRQWVELPEKGKSTQASIQLSLFD